MGAFQLRDYLGNYNQASRTTAQKLGMRMPDPVTKDPVSAGIEGAIGGGLAAASAIGAMGGMPAMGDGGAGIETKTPDSGLMQKPGAIEPGTGLMERPQAVTPGNAVTGSSPGGLSRFFNFFGGAQG